MRCLILSLFAITEICLLQTRACYVNLKINTAKMLNQKYHIIKKDGLVESYPTEIDAQQASKTSRRFYSTKTDKIKCLNHPKKVGAYKCSECYERFCHRCVFMFSPQGVFYCHKHYWKKFEGGKN